MGTVIRLRCHDLDEAKSKASQIYTHLGPGFFPDVWKNPQQVIQWITRILFVDTLRVEFNDPSDALIFKLTFGGS